MQQNSYFKLKGMQVPRKLMNVKEAADFFRVVEQTIYQWKYEGKIPYVKVNGKLLFEYDQLLKYAMGEE